ncbi:MAG: glucose-6-phosphate isomerase family protein [Candidatus Brocadiia bacterium]
MMDELFAPLRVDIFPDTGLVGPEQTTNAFGRHLSDMRGTYQDAAATEALIARQDPLLYQVYTADVPDEHPHLLFGTTVIYPGKVGDEFYMTKGHYHAVEHTAEVYYCLRGRGYILMECRAGEVAGRPVAAGQAVYIPPGWAHRSVNVGDEEFVFFFAYPGGAGHDYEAFEHLGFRNIVIDREGQPVVLPNPRFQ